MSCTVASEESLTSVVEACRIAEDHWAAGRGGAAVEAAWKAYDVELGSREAKVLLSELLFWFPAEIRFARREGLLKLLRDLEIDPDYIGMYTWFFLLQNRYLRAVQTNSDFSALAAFLNEDELALTVLHESAVCHRVAESVLTRLRRWLLTSGKWPDYQHLVDALVAQTAINRGAWPFDSAENLLLRDMSEAPIFRTYFPFCEGPSSLPEVTSSNPVTQAVTQGYERWPFPVWRRVSVRGPERLGDRIRQLDPSGPSNFPIKANLLIAGCGTGKEAASVAVRYRDAVVTAIDVSESSLRFAKRQCSTLGLNNIRFLKLDLHDVSKLKERFDAIFCSGVLHHLPDPESGLKALGTVLQPAGVMRIMVYSRTARLWLTAARTLIHDLAAEPPSDDLLRRIRQGVMGQNNCWRANFLMSWPDFSTLPGTYDLLLHSHEDPFDISRISQVLHRLGLRLLSFQLPTPYARACYRKKFPDDPMQRNAKYLASFERDNPTVFFGMYDFWCRDQTSS